jgi:hypothetical protein
VTAGERVKYPRTPHLPWSGGIEPDDTVLPALDGLRAAAEVVVTEKLDGECTTIGPGGWTHARSLDSGPHPSRSYVRALAGRIGHEIPPGYRICGENLYAVHSIAYQALADHFQVFNVWAGATCLSWDDTETLCGALDLVVVPVLYRGPLPDRAELDRSWAAGTAGCESEGYVVRDAGAFPRAEFGARVGKYVRPHHVRTTEHWLNQELRVNGLRP